MTAPATIDREALMRQFATFVRLLHEGELSLSPAPPLEREIETMYVSDAELIRRLGVGEKLGRTILNELCTKHPGFPKKQPAFGNRRYWPAVRAYFDKMNGINPQATSRAI